MLLDAPKALWRWAFLYIVSNKHSFALSVDHVGNIWGARKLCISYLVSGFLPHWFRLNFCLKIFKMTLISLLIPSIISSSLSSSSLFLTLRFVAKNQSISTSIIHKSDSQNSNLNLHSSITAFPKDRTDHLFASIIPHFSKLPVVDWIVSPQNSSLPGTSECHSIWK